MLHSQACGLRRVVATLYLWLEGCPAQCLMQSPEYGNPGQL